MPSSPEVGERVSGTPSAPQALNEATRKRSVRLAIGSGLAFGLLIALGIILLIRKGDPAPVAPSSPSTSEVPDAAPFNDATSELPTPSAPLPTPSTNASAPVAPPSASAGPSARPPGVPSGRVAVPPADTSDPFDTPPPLPEPPPPGPFNYPQAERRLAIIAAGVHSCRGPRDPSGKGVARVSFNRDGSVLSAVLQMPPGMGSSLMAQCIAQQFRKAQVDPFTGGLQTVAQPFSF